ncbi:MAG: thiamine-phosphate kinase [Rhizobiales bacterium]|nr:thiamine-phosphate kinase [Hyphomicrobiales bacterium]
MAKQTSTTVSGEERIIDLFRPLARHPGAFGLIDDCAAITPAPGTDLVLKADAIVGGVHFFPDDPAGDVARKALRVNLSDLAAKGAKPIGFLLTLALPSGVGMEWVANFAQGLSDDVERYGCLLLGGDTVSTPGPVTVSVAVFGSVPTGTMVRRGGAKAGDRVLVSGTIGDAALGVRLCRDVALTKRWGLSTAQTQHLIGRYRLPQPHNAVAEALREFANGAMDVSDGLAGDLDKMCRASGVSATIHTERVPLSDAARSALAADPSLLEPILTGGDDYEILAAVEDAKLAPLRHAAAAAGVTLTEIGSIAGGDGARVLGGDGKVLAFRQASYSHF